VTTARSSFARRLPLLCAAAALTGCAAYQYHSDGMRLAAEGKGDAALPLLRMATQAEPLNGEYRIDLLRETAHYVGDLLARADEARRAGQGEVAADLYNKVLRVEPSNDRARRGLDTIERDARNTRLLAEAETMLREERIESARAKVDAVLATDPANAAARRLQRTLADAADRERDAKAAALAARSVMNKPVIVFGNIFYSYFPNVRTVRDYSQLTEALDWALAYKPLPSAELIEATAAYVQFGKPGKFDFLVSLNDREALDSVADLVADQL